MKKAWLLGVLSLGVTLGVGGQSYLIETVAGGYTIADGGPATNAFLHFPTDVVVDKNGNIFLADTGNQRIRKIAPNGVITTVAGTGTMGFSGDGGRAIDAQLNLPNGVAVDDSGQIYIADSGNQRIRRVDIRGVITTIAGTGIAGFGGDTGPATAAQLWLDAAWDLATGLAFDDAGALLVSDVNNHRVRRIDPSGIITTIAGNGTDGFTGEGGTATAVSISKPRGLTFRKGILYIADSGAQRVHRVSASGVLASSPIAIGVNRYQPFQVAFDGEGNLTILQTHPTGVLLQVVSGAVTTLIGTDGKLAYPAGMAIADSTMYIAETLRHRLLSVDGNRIRTVAGDRLLLHGPEGLALDPRGNLYIADSWNGQVSKLTPAGVLSSVATLPTPNSPLAIPRGVALDRDGNLYVTDYSVDGIWRVTGPGNYQLVPLNVINMNRLSGEDAPPLSGGRRMLDIVFDAAGRFYYSQVSAGGPVGIFRAVLPLTVPAQVEQFAPQVGSPALSMPKGLFLQPLGNLYIADQGGHRIFVADQLGNMRATAGTGAAGFGGDGGPALSAQLSSPRAVVLDSAGNVYIADQSNHRIRRISGGVITTIAGTGVPGFSGDNGLATSAQLNFPAGLAVDASGVVWVSDHENQRIRRLTPLVASALQIAGGNGQSGAAGTRLSNPLVVQVTGQRGLAVAGATVTFAVTAGSATLSATSVTTGVDGTASVAVTLGNAAGSVMVTAVVSGLAPVTFNLTATAVTPAAPRIAAGGVVGGGLSSPPVRTLSPNAIVSVFGENFAPAGTQRLVSGADLVNGRLPTKLGGVCVQIGSEPARIFHVFPGQINLQVPTLAGSGNVEVQVIVNCGEANEVRSNPETVAFEAAAPEFFFFERLGEGRARVAAVNASRPGQTPRPGDVVTVYMTGLGLTDPAFAVGELPDRAGSVVGSLAVTLGGSELAAQDVLYAGVTPLLAGVYQLNIRIAAGRGGGDVPIGVRIGSASTPAGALVTLGP